MLTFCPVSFGLIEFNDGGRVHLRQLIGLLGDKQGLRFPSDQTKLLQRLHIAVGKKSLASQFTSARAVHESRHHNFGVRRGRVSIKQSIQRNQIHQLFSLWFVSFIYMEQIVNVLINPAIISE